MKLRTAVATILSVVTLAATAPISKEYTVQVTPLHEGKASLLIDEYTSIAELYIPKMSLLGLGLLKINKKELHMRCVHTEHENGITRYDKYQFGKKRIDGEYAWNRADSMTHYTNNVTLEERTFFLPNPEALNIPQFLSRADTLQAGYYDLVLAGQIYSAHLDSTQTLSIDDSFIQGHVHSVTADQDGNLLIKTPKCDLPAVLN